MHRSEANQLVHCVSCGAEISIGLDRTFAITEEAALCFSCALNRGGNYDEGHDTWSRAPQLTGLEWTARDW